MRRADWRSPTATCISGPRSLDGPDAIPAERASGTTSRPTARRIASAWQNGDPAYPKSRPTPRGVTRGRPSGGPPGTDLEFTRRQHLDPFNVALGLINPPLPSQNFMNSDLGNAICRALNDCQIDCAGASRSRGCAPRSWSITRTRRRRCAEIERCAGDRGYGHVLLMSRTSEPTRLARAMSRSSRLPPRPGLPVAMHAFGFGGHPAHLVRLAVVLPRGHDRPRPGLPGASHQPGHRGRVRAPAEPALRHDRGRLRLAAVAGLAARQALEDAGGRDAASASALPSEYIREPGLADHPADGGAAEPRAPAGPDRLDRLGPAAVRLGLSALGLRRSDRRRCRCASTETRRRQVFRDNAHALYGG